MPAKKTLFWFLIIIVMGLKVTPVLAKETYPLNTQNPIYSLSLDAQVNLTAENSFLRFILVTKDKKEYLIKELSPLLSEQPSISLKNACEETCGLPGVTPDFIRIEKQDANYQITKVNFEKPAKLSAQATEQSKIQTINRQIKAKGLKWVAGETSVSRLSYEEKKKLFRKPDGTILEELPNLQGFEYYKGGIFEIPSLSEEPTPTSSPSLLPDSWDWRNVHGENWNSPAKNQAGAGTCGPHAFIGTFESQINLYYNQHLDLNLSEQMLLDCSKSRDPELGMVPELFSFCGTIMDDGYFSQDCPGFGYCALSQHGIFDELCDPYNPQRFNDINETTCNLSNICPNWQSRIWKNSDFRDYLLNLSSDWPRCTKITKFNNAEDLKRVLIEGGPLNSGIDSWMHSMVLVGYSSNKSDWKFVDDCTVMHFCSETNGCVPVECNNPGQELTICNNAFDSSFSTILVGKLIHYSCQQMGGNRNWWIYQGDSYCAFNERCVDNQCQPMENFKLATGDRACIRQELSEYRQGEGETYWIFKNSWGENWGENGYVKVATSLNNMRLASLPIGPFTPPTDHTYWPAGFDGAIKCVDKDNDGYCNWGISPDKPSTCPASCKPEKDCNDANPNLGSFDENLNCTVIPPCPLHSQGDADCNDQINILDFGYWRIEFLKAINNEAPPAGGWKSDFDDDGSPTIVDFGRWRKYFLINLR